MSAIHSSKSAKCGRRNSKRTRIITQLSSLCRRLPAVCAGLGLLFALRVAAAEEPASQSQGDTNLTIFQIDPLASNAAEASRVLAAMDREIGRLVKVNASRRGVAQAEAAQRLDKIRDLRKEFDANRTKPGWEKLLSAVFAAMEANRLAEMKLDDVTLWNLSRNRAFVDAGHVTIVNLCAPCHLPNLKGQTGAGFGPDLTDQTWLHGGKPSEIYDFITKGAFDRGMPPWGSIIGTKKVIEATAYVLSKHEEGEPVYEYGVVPSAAELMRRTGSFHCARPLLAQIASADMMGTSPYEFWPVSTDVVGHDEQPAAFRRGSLEEYVSIQAPILNRFEQMRTLDPLSAGEISNRARHLENPIIGPR